MASDDKKIFFSDINVSLKYAKFSIKCKFEDDGVLPKFKGSAFRGIFGRALQKISCGLDDKNCQDCELKYNCLYAKVFECNDEKNDEGETQASIHPYIIEPLDNIKTLYHAGDYFFINLILFGDFIFEIPRFIYAIIEMGKLGIGKATDKKGHARFSLQSVSIKNNIIYDANEKVVKNEIVKENISIIDKSIVENYGLKGQKLVKISLDTPLRFKNNSLLNRSDLQFVDLVKVILRRLVFLFKFYGDGKPSFDSNEIFKEASDVKVISNSLFWQDKKRYSFRQEASMLFGGLCGEIIYEGNIEKFIFLLKIAEIMHLGKQTSFGLGKINWTLDL